MIQKKEDKAGMIEIDLTGPEGNVFSLMAAARQLGRSMGTEQIDALIEDMMSSDYEHAVTAFDNKFGDYVLLLR